MCEKGECRCVCGGGRVGLWEDDCVCGVYGVFMHTNTHVLYPLTQHTHTRAVSPLSLSHTHTTTTTKPTQAADIDPPRRLHIKVHLLEQLPWPSAVVALGLPVITHHTLPILTSLLTEATDAVARGDEDSELMLLRLLCVLCTLLGQLATAPDVQEHVGLLVLVSLLAVCRQTSSGQLCTDHPQLVCFCVGRRVGVLIV